MIRQSKSPITKAHVHQSLGGMVYPASREELIKFVRDKNQYAGVSELLKKLPSIEYQNEPQVLSTLREYADV